MYINYLNQDLRVSTDMHEEPKILNILRLSNTLIDLVLQTLADCL